MQTIKVVNITDEDDFTKQVNDLLNDGYKISSTDCGFIQSEQYDFCSSFMAILVKEQ